MPKQRTLLIALALIAIGIGVLLWRPARPHFTEDQFDQIQIGMTRAKVEAVLGCGPGDYTQMPTPLHFPIARGDARDWVADTSDLPFFDQHGTSQQNALAIQVFFEDGLVTGKHNLHFTYTPTTLLERLRAWWVGS